MNPPQEHSLTPKYWQPSRSLTLAAAHRHTEFVRMLSWLSYLAAGSVVFLLIYYIVQGRSASVSETVLGNESVKMTNPRFTGLDGDGQPYSLTADYAVRDIQDPDAVRLANPVLSFLRNENSQDSGLVASEGVFAHKTQTLDLRSDVAVKLDDGARCETSHAHIDLQGKFVKGHEPIKCTGRFGVASGDQFEILDNYARFIFLGNVTGTLFPRPEIRLERADSKL